MKRIISGGVLTLAIALAFAAPSFARAEPSAGAAPASISTAVSREDIITRVRNMKLVARNITRIEAKRVSWVEFTQAFPIPEKNAPGLPNATVEVWVVAVSGTYVPTHSKGESYQWGVMVFDAATGRWIRTDAGNNGSWPAFFNALPVTP